MKPVVLRNVVVILALVAVMLLIKLFDLIVAPNHVFPGRVASFAWAELAIVAGAGLIAALLAAHTTVVHLVPPERPVATMARALLLGAGLGALLALLDAWLRIGDISVGLPLAPLFYLWGGIGQEILTHLAPAAIVVGLAGFVARDARVQTIAFWLVAAAMSAIAAAGMMAAFGNPDIPLSSTVAAAPMLIGAAVLAIELALFAMLWKRGFVAALAMRLGFYAVWHIAWPALTY